MRFNFLGGPGSGKSTTSAWVFSELKSRNYSVELVNEYVKAWAYEKRTVNEFDQVYLFAKQMQYEYRFLKSGVRNIITDSPTDLSAVYAKVYYSDINIWRHIQEINKEYNNKYPSVNIFLERGDKIYHQEGRYQTHEQAKEIDNLIKDYLKNERKERNFFIPYNDREQILNTVLIYADK